MEEATRGTLEKWSNTVLGGEKLSPLNVKSLVLNRFSILVHRVVNLPVPFCGVPSWYSEGGGKSGIGEFSKLW
jgi:hypothetical protein